MPSTSSAFTMVLIKPITVLSSPAQENEENNSMVISSQMICFIIIIAPYHAPGNSFCTERTAASMRSASPDHTAFCSSS